MGAGVMRRYLTPEEQVRLLAAAKSRSDRCAQRDYWWMRLLMDTGMRIQEFALLSVGDAIRALDEGWIYIPAEHRKGHRAKGAEKATRRPHEVRVTATVREALDALLHIYDQGLRFSEDRVWHAPLVWSRNGQRMSVRSYQARMAYWCGVANLPAASPHWLRHTRAMNVLRQSTAANPLGVVQLALGHESLSSTGIYTRMSKEDLAAALDQVDGPRRLSRRQVRRAAATRRAAA